MATLPELTMSTMRPSPAQVELLWVFASYAYVLTQHTVRTVPITKKHFKFSRNVTLLIHIALALAEVIRYHSQAAFLSSSSSLFSSSPTNNKPNHPPFPVPNTWDLLLVLGHSVTALRLARDRKMGDRVLTRATHQSLALMRIGLGLAAYFCTYAYTGTAYAGQGRGPFYHRAAARVMNAFLYPRLLIKALGALDVLRGGYASVYAASMFIASLLCLHDAGVSFGPQIFLGVLAANLVVNRWVARMVVLSEKSGQSRGLLVDWLYRAGFAELETLRVGREAIAREKGRDVCS